MPPHSSRLLALLVLANRGVSLTVGAPPVVLLGGFLGTGKTTTLKNLLTNREGLRIGVIVNDVAAVNVDAMEVRRTTVESGDGVEMVQLENGCVCCSAAGDLVPAVRKMVDEHTGPPFDHVVIELSGVADPENVERSLKLGGFDVDRKVALVDANAFPELYGTVEVARERTDLAGEEETDPCAVDRRVVELLLQQIETADVILVNKVDLASEDELRTTQVACRALNENASIISTTFGDASLAEVLPAGAGATFCVPAGRAAPQSLEHSHDEVTALTVEAYPYPYPYS